MTVIYLAKFMEFHCGHGIVGWYTQNFLRCRFCVSWIGTHVDARKFSRKNTCERSSWLSYGCCAVLSLAIATDSLLFCSVILFPIAITFYITWWFIHLVDGFFSPIYAQLGIDIFGKHVLYLVTLSHFHSLFGDIIMHQFITCENR